MVISSALATQSSAPNTGEGESIDVAMYETMPRRRLLHVDYMNKGVLYPWGTHIIREGAPVRDRPVQDPRMESWACATGPFLKNKFARGHWSGGSVREQKSTGHLSSVA